MPRSPSFELTGLAVLTFMSTKNIDFCFVCVCSRRRSSSLGSCDEEKEELSSVQLSKRIHVLKKKIHRFEEKFEYERKYRVSKASMRNGKYFRHFTWNSAK